MEDSKPSRRRWGKEPSVATPTEEHPLLFTEVAQTIEKDEHLDQAHALQQARAAQLQKIERDTADLLECHQLLAEHVERQGEQLDVVERNLEQSRHETEQGVGELAQAAQYHAAAERKKAGLATGLGVVATGLTFYTFGLSYAFGVAAISYFSKTAYENSANLNESNAQKTMEALDDKEVRREELQSTLNEPGSSTQHQAATTELNQLEAQPASTSSSWLPSLPTFWERNQADDSTHSLFDDMDPDVNELDDAALDKRIAEAMKKQGM